MGKWLGAAPKSERAEVGNGSYFSALPVSFNIYQAEDGFLGVSRA
jgi:hypothetical protein